MVTDLADTTSLFPRASPAENQESVECNLSERVGMKWWIFSVDLKITQLEAAHDVVNIISWRVAAQPQLLATCINLRDRISLGGIRSTRGYPPV